MPEPIRKIVVTFIPAWKQELHEAKAEHGFGELKMVFSEEPEAIVLEMADADVALVGLLDAPILEAGKQLRLIQAFSGGVNGMLFPQLVTSDVPLTCMKPCFGTVGAEHALAAMLMFARRFHFPPQSRPMTQWDDGYDEVAKPVDLSGATVGIVGLGNMGLALAQRARCLGMRVMGLTRQARPATPEVDRLYTPEKREKMLSQCDFVVIAVPMTDATMGMVDAAFLAAMKTDAYLIDTSGRPAVFDYAALEAAMDSQAIAGVCLQPGGGAGAEIGTPPLDAAFWSNPNVVVTPCRGTSQQTRSKGLDLFFQNLRLLEAGEPLLGLVDKEAGY